jgi:hypothetical protein
MDMDVQALVKAGMLPSDSALRLLIAQVNTAYRDAQKLVGRIRDQRQDTDRALPEEPTLDLLDSLQLGTVRVCRTDVDSTDSPPDLPRGNVPICAPTMG